MYDFDPDPPDPDDPDDLEDGDDGHDFIPAPWLLLDHDDPLPF